MAFQRMETNVENVSALPDIVAEQSAQLKQTFDKAGKDLKAFVNTHITELELGTAAESLGAKTPDGLPSTVQAELNAVNVGVIGKVDKVEGKQLSTEDYTTEEKDKLEGIEENANNYVLPVASTSEHGGIKVDGVTIVVEGGVAKAIAADSADYTARAEISDLRGDVQGLESDLETKANTSSNVNITVETTDWVEDTTYTGYAYKATKAVAGVTTDSNLIVGLTETATAEQEEAAASSGIACKGKAQGTIDLYVKELPTVSLPVSVIVLG